MSSESCSVDYIMFFLFSRHLFLSLPDKKSNQKLTAGPIRPTCKYIGKSKLKRTKDS